jgi:hypothetical protein
MHRCTEPEPLPLDSDTLSLVGSWKNSESD